MEDKNVKQKEFWSGAGGDVWVNKQKEMDIMLTIPWDRGQSINWIYLTVREY
tara:strand:- start:585 stop:740 length:156 start_codon:yes stop_codon:yes gene_type:complete